MKMWHVWLAGGLFVVAFLFAVLKQASYVDYKPEPHPEKTLEAPFVDQTGAQPPAGGLQSLYTEDPGIEADETVAGELARPHRQQEQISDWLVRAVSEIMDIDGNDYVGHLKHLATGMDEAAIANYRTFMDNSHILEALRNNGYKLHSFVEEKPLLLNKGVVDGRYRWLFEMPVTLTFLPVNASSYKGTQPVNQYVIIQIQAGRVALGQGVDELMIEKFEVRKNPARN